MSSLPPAIFATLVVLATSVTVDADGYIMRIDGRSTSVCAKTREACELARRFVAHPPAEDPADKNYVGWFMIGLPSGTPTWCEPSPTCFNARSNCIPGYTGPRPEGICR